MICVKHGQMLSEEGYCYVCEDEWEEKLKSMPSIDNVVYLCCICGEVPVDVNAGYDTCDECVGRI